MILSKHFLTSTGVNHTFGPFRRGTKIRSITVTQRRAGGTAGDLSGTTLDVRMFGSAEEVPPSLLSWPANGGERVWGPHPGVALATLYQINADCGYARIPVNIEVDRFPVLGISIAEAGAGFSYGTVTVETDAPNPF